MARWKDRKKEAAAGIGYGWHKDGKHFGSDIKQLCSHGYTYVQCTLHADTWYMFIYDNSVDENGYKKDIDEADEDNGGVCHMLLSKGAFNDPKHGVIGHTCKVDLSVPGTEAYYYTQKYKRTEYVGPETYYEDLTLEERRYVRTRKQKRKNDYKRSEIRARRKRDKELHEKCPIYPYNKEYYDKLIEKTYIDDEENPLYGFVGYTVEYIYAYQDIALDIDGHDIPNEWCQQLCDDFAKLLQRGCDDNGEIISDVLPDTIVKTGRGLQLHFKFKPVASPAVTMVKSVRDRLIEIYDAIVKEYYPDLELDIAASKRLDKPCRLPGSYNWKALSQDPERFGQYGYKVTELKSKVVDQEQQRTIEDYMTALGIPVYKHKKQSTQAETVAASKDNIRSDSKKYAEDTTKKKSISRGKKYIPFLRDYAKNVSIGQRDNFLFIAGTLVKEAGENVSDILTEINETFGRSLPYSELRATIKSVVKKDYHYKTVTINVRLGVTEADLRPYGLTMCGAMVDNETKKRQRKEAREARDREVLRMLKEGKSVSAVAEITGHCRETIRGIRDAARLKAATAQKKAEEAVRNIKERKDSYSQFLTGIAEKLSENCSISIPDFTIDMVHDMQRVLMTS